MRKGIFYVMTAALVMVSSAYVMVSSAPEFKLKSDYAIKFKSKDPSGEFKTMSGSIKFDENDLAGSKFDLTFDVSSINTGNGMKNKKAQTSEWFDAAKHPSIRYVSSKVEKSGNEYMVYGNLSIRGISKEYKVPVKVSKSGSDLVFTGDFGVNRLDFKVGKKSNVVPDVMNVSFSIPVTKK